MKKFQLFKHLLVFLFFTALLITGCNQEQEEFSPASNESKITTGLGDIQPTKIRDGKLVFDSPENFRKALKEVTTKTDEQLDCWGNSIGFSSMRYEFSKALNEFDLIETQEQLTAFKKKYTGKLKFEDGSIQMLFDYKSVSSLLNNEGIVYIGKNLYKFLGDEQIIIEGSEVEKLSVAEKTRKSDFTKGIHVLSVLPEINYRTCNSSSLSSEDITNDNRRLRTTVRVYGVYLLLYYQNGQPVYDNDFFFNNNGNCRKKSGLNWIRTWIDVAREIDADLFSSNCTSLIVAPISINDTLFDRADWDTTYYLGTINIIGACNLLFFGIDATIDRIEDSSSAEDLVCVISCH